MQQQPRLLADRRDDARMRVADVGHCHTGNSVQIFAPRLIPQARAQALGETQGQWLVGVHQGGGHDVKLHCRSVYLQYG